MAVRVPANASLYDRFAVIVDRQGLCVAIVTAEQTVTYVALKTAIDNCATVLAGKGLQSGQLIGLHFSRPEFYMIAILAANRLGVGVVQAETIDSQALIPRPNLFLSDERIIAEKRPGATIVDASWLAKKDASHLPLGRTARDSVIYMFGTSGSTGKRKFLRVSENNILARIPSKQHMIDENTRLLATVGPRTAISTELHLTALLSGASAVMLPPEPQNLPYYIDLFGVTTLVSTPMLVADLIALNLPREIYRSLDRVVMAGAAATKETIERTVARICPNLILSYGSTETGTTANFYYNPDEYVPGIVGKINPGVELELIDDDSRPVEAGATGTIRIRRQGVLAENAYSNLPDEKEDRFIGDWFYPGDLGRFDEHGNLIISGRDDNIINAGGNKYAVELIESELEKVLGASCIVLSGKPARSLAQIIIVAQSDKGIDVPLSTEFVQGRFKRVGIERIYEIRELPKTDSGKKDRPGMERFLENNHENLTMVYPEPPR